MITAIKKIRDYIKGIFERNDFVEKHTLSSTFNSKFYLQIIVSVAFLILTITNIVSQSYIMLIFTAIGCLTNSVCAIIGKKLHNSSVCAYSAIITCSLMFAFFVIYGGNEGFACLWVVLLPFLSMVVMDFVAGLCASIFFQLFLIVVFWTPIRGMLLYQYNAQFCLRFPLFFLVTFMLGLALTIFLRRSQYNECMQLLKLEEMTKTANNLARIDTLTELANRRCAYEEFKTRFSQNGIPHCVVMGDIDYFKRINDSYGHEFGDEVLVIVAKYIKELLPDDYLKSRWGGEEFLLVANKSVDEVYKEIESLRIAISEHQFCYNGVRINVTITFGLAGYVDSNDLDKAINIADNRLYTGKKTTKNCTIAE